MPAPKAPVPVSFDQKLSFLLLQLTPIQAQIRNKTHKMPESNAVVVTRSSSLQPSGGQTEGMIRSNALTNLTNGICASQMIARPHTASAVHHHAEQDTVVFAFSGHGTIVSDGGKSRQELKPGDFALIPAYAEHQEVNDSDEDVVWSIVRAPGGEPKVVNLDGWGKS